MFDKELESKYAYRSSKVPLCILVSYLVVSLFLSICILSKWITLFYGWVPKINVALNICNFLVVPSASSILLFYWSVYPLLSHFSNKNRLKHVAIAILSVFLIFFVGCSYNSALPQYTFSWIPIFSMILFSKIWRKAQRRLCSKKIIIFISLASILIPHVSVFACYNGVLLEASLIVNESDRVIFVSSYVNRITAFGYPFRANDDLWKFLLSSSGRCGEMATATVTFLNNLNIKARKVSFPGEDHAFVEVKINGTWYVVDPGYYSSAILTREERASLRIGDLGAISYVIAYTDSSFVELTQYYVKTDTIIIRITYNGEPLANAKIYLKHKFMGRTMRLPDSSSAFYTDGNGTVVLHMGALTYNSKAEPYEPYYWIYVNDKNTSYTVTSTGTGKTHLTEIDSINSSFADQNSILK